MEFAEPEHELAIAGDITNFANQTAYPVDDEPVEEFNATHQVVASFLQYFHAQLLRGNVTEIQQCYESVFGRLSERYFKNSAWPHASEIADIVNNDAVFLLLYNELYFRHIYSKLTPTVAQRLESWENYRKLFSSFAEAAKTKSAGAAQASSNEAAETLSFATLEIPYQWLWEMIDEFIYQFQSFYQNRSKAQSKARSAEEIAEWKAAGNAWGVFQVLQSLETVVQASEVNKWLDADRSSGKTHQELKKVVPSHIMLGYFCLIGLLRVHVVLGDYHTGLLELQKLDFQKKAPLFTRVTACHITVYYSLGFSFLMLRRYSDAIKCFSHILSYISRTRQYHSRFAQFDQITKKNDRMYALLAISISVCPQRLDEVLQTNLREKYGDKLARLAKGEDPNPIFEELFAFACPKFVTVAPPQWDAGDASSPIDAYKHQLSIFLSDIQQQEKHPLIRSYLKLYTTISLAKLSSFVSIPAPSLRQLLIALKHKTRSKVRSLNEPPLSGTPSLNTDVDFSLDGEVVHVEDSKNTAPYAEFFIRHISKFEEIVSELTR